MSKHFFWLAILIALIWHEAHAQGCSDAGFCTMGAMKPDQGAHKHVGIHLNSLEIGHYIGLTNQGTVIQATTADMNFLINDRYNLQLKLPYQTVNGELGSTRGLGDISVSFTAPLLTGNRYQINGTLGFKLPTGTPNKTYDGGRPLPMYYQTTLGTYDLVAGASYLSHRWLVAVGYQQPFNRVENEFFWGAWADSEKFDQALEYPVSQDLLRGNDIMLRVERNFRLSKVNFNLGLLHIYRVTKDSFRDPASGQIIDKDDSVGLALTLLTGAGYNFTAKSTLKLMAGYAIIQRKANPDGLARDFVSTLSYQFRF